MQRRHNKQLEQKLVISICKGYRTIPTLPQRNCLPESFSYALWLKKRMETYGATKEEKEDFISKWVETLQEAWVQTTKKYTSETADSQHQRMGKQKPRRFDFHLMQYLIWYGCFQEYLPRTRHSQSHHFPMPQACKKYRTGRGHNK